jgi:shikimate kinase
MKVNIVCGPPGSGKSTYVRKHMEHGDLVMDQDAIYSALSFLPLYDRPMGLLPIVLDMRACLFRMVETNQKAEFENFWIITSGESIFVRQRFAYRFNAKVFVLMVPPEECIRRIEADERRSNQMELWKSLIDKWWQEYKQDPADIIIKEEPA